MERATIFDSLVLEYVARPATAVHGARMNSGSKEPARFRGAGAMPARQTNSERSMKAKIELCVIRQVFDFKNYKDWTNPALADSACAEVEAGMNSLIKPVL